MTKYTLSLLTLTIALSSTTAFAEVALGDPIHASADLVFVSPFTVSHDLVSAGDLRSGDQTVRYTPVATGTVGISGTEASSVLVEWVNGTDGGGGYGFRRTFLGSSSGGSLTLELRGGAATPSDPEGNGRRLKPYNGAPTSGNFGYVIHADNTGNVDVKADTYNIVLKAQAYTA
jgi:hypothetical protein